MFDFVHEKKRLVQIVLAFIILPFVLWGVDSYRNAGEVGVVATVNGEKITQGEFEEAMLRQRQQLREALGENLDFALLDSAKMKNAVIQGLITQRLLLSAANDAGLTVSDEQMARLIARIPAFQKDGVFDKATYEAVLRAQGMNPALFEYRLRQDMLARQLTDALAQNGYAAATSVDNLIRLNERAFTVSLATLDLAAFRNQAKVSEEEIRAYYEANLSQFQLPEAVQVEYVALSAERLATGMPVTATEVEQYYREHAGEFSIDEQRRAAHILIGVAKNATEAEKRAAKNKAESILQQVRANPKNFAVLAKQYSEDPGSAANGGDLGMFGRGMMVKPFEDATFSLKVGEISDLVETDFGFHIIKLLEIQPAKIRPLAEVQAQIEQIIRQQRAQERFAELAESFSNTVYEQSDSLQPAAQLVGAKVEGPIWLNRGQPAQGWWNEKMLQAIFSDEAIKEKRNTSALEVAPNVLLAARVIQHRAASTRPLPEVTEEIRQRLLDQAALQAATKQGEMLLTQLQNGEKVSLRWGKTQTLQRLQQSEINPELVRRIFAAKTDNLPQYVAVADAQQGYLIARIEAVSEVSAIEPQKRENYAQQIRQMTGEALLQAYLEELRAKAKIEIRQPVVADN